MPWRVWDGEGNENVLGVCVAVLPEAILTWLNWKNSLDLHTHEHSADAHGLTGSLVLTDPRIASHPTPHIYQHMLHPIETFLRASARRRKRTRMDSILTLVVCVSFIIERDASSAPVPTIPLDFKC